MSLDYNQPIDIDIESEILNVNELPDKIRSTHRFLAKFVSIANYRIDANMTLYFYYKQLNDDTEYSITYTVSKDEERFKQKLPVGINCREWRWRLVGEGLTDFEMSEVEVLWLPRRIGDR